MKTPSTFPDDRDLELDLSGERLAGFRLKHRIGRGGMSDVYLAEQESLKRLVAVKVLRRSLSKSETYVRRFQNEAHAAASLTHGNIVQIIEVGASGESYYIAQEYVRGENLGQVLVRHGRFTEQLTVSILMQVAAALQKAADAGIVHRDIKPENIMVTQDGEVKVADFGLARITRDDQALNLTQIGMTLGTPLYMSPEQVEGKPLDYRSDIYSLGVTAFHMLTGHPPFEGESAFAVALKHLKEPTPDPRDEVAEISADMCAIVAAMMAKNRNDRPANPAAVTQMLRKLPSATGDLGEMLKQKPETSGGATTWNSPELAQLVQEHLATTQRLETVMMAQRSLQNQRTRFWPIVLSVTVALAAGAVIGLVSRPTSVLATSSTLNSTVAKKATVAEQWWLATDLNTEAAWLSVSQYFPANESEMNRVYGLKAKRGLADLLFEKQQYERAQQVYHELTQLSSDSELQLRFSGLIGEANVHATNREMSKTRQFLTQVISLLPRLKKQNGNGMRSDDVRHLLVRPAQENWDDLMEVYEIMSEALP